MEGTARGVQRLVTLLLIAAATAPSVSGQEPKRPRAKPYLNMPATYPLAPGQWAAVPAFPKLRFTAPTFLTHVPGTSRLCVLEREGVIKTFENDPRTKDAAVMLDIQDRCQGQQDSGLLGLAFHPDFGKPGAKGRGWFFICYNFTPTPVRAPQQPPEQTPTKVRLSRFTIPDGEITADFESELVLIEQDDRNLFHTGGAMFFHPDDGFLYVAFGDEGSYGGRLGNSQRIDQGLFGGVIRIDVDNDPSRSHPPPRQPQRGKTAHYGIPNDNPFVAMPGVLEEFYAHGLRSPHRMTIDPVTKQIWLGDVGDGGHDPREEVNLIVRGGNYQWNYKEGNEDRPVYAARPANLIGVEQPPVYEYPHAGGDRCVIGGYVYHGPEHSSELGGKYIFGDYGVGRIWAMDYRHVQPPQITELCTLPSSSFRLTSFGTDERGELYLCTVEGRILKLARAGTPALPLTEQKPLPRLLSQTGAFADVRTLSPSASVLPYEVNVPLWSDHSQKLRWLALPARGAIRFSATDEWRFPPGAVFIKHFDLPVDDTNAAVRERLETRLLVIARDGSAYGVTYKWRADASDAVLLDGALTESVRVKTASGHREQVWTYPSRSDCLVCHNAMAGWVLGVNTRQMNRPCPDGGAENQLARWSRLGMFNRALSADEISQCGRLFALDDSTASVADRARSYLDANCAYCHRPLHLQQLFDARFETPLRLQRLVDAPAYRGGNQGGTLLIDPGRPHRSLLLQRLLACDGERMPPLGRSIADHAAATVVAAWIDDIAYERRLWFAKGIALAVIGLSLSAAATAWLRGWWLRRGLRPLFARLLAGVPFTLTLAACLAIPLTTRDQGNAARFLAIVNGGFALFCLSAIEWRWRRTPQQRRPTLLDGHRDLPDARAA